MTTKTIQIEIPEALANQIGDLADRIRTQDGHFTKDPIYCVVRTKRIYGFDADYSDRPPVWVDEECNEIDFEFEAKNEGIFECEQCRVMLSAEDFEAEKCSACFNCFNPEDFGLQLVHYDDEDLIEQVFLTENAARLYIANQRGKGENWETLRVSVESAYRNPEQRALRELLQNWPKAV